VPQRGAGALDLVRAGLAHDLQRRLGEAEQAGRRDRVGAEHAPGRVDRQRAQMAVSPANFAAPDPAGLVPAIKRKLKKIQYRPDHRTLAMNCEET
jgi:hypothetical protein